MENFWCFKSCFVAVRKLFFLLLYPRVPPLVFKRFVRFFFEGGGVVIFGRIFQMIKIIKLFFFNCFSVSLISPTNVRKQAKSNSCYITTIPGRCRSSLCCSENKAKLRSTWFKFAKIDFFKGEWRLEVRVEGRYP